MKPLFQNIHFPLSGPPEGASQIGRWHQLDPSSLSLVEFWATSAKDLPHPGGMVLASCHGSNESDEAFFQSGLTSPHRFVHTLPSVRITSFCQLLGWRGPVLCVQDDPKTISASLKEAILHLPDWKRAWVLGISRRDPSTYGVVLFSLTLGEESNCNHWLELTDAEIWGLGPGN